MPGKKTVRHASRTVKRKARATPLRKAEKAPAGRRAAKNQTTRQKLDAGARKQAVPPDKPGKSSQSEITVCKRAEEAMRQSEQRMRAILDGALDAVVEMDAQGTVTQWNPRAEAIFGWTRSEAVGRQLSATIIPPQHREAHARGLQHFLATGEGPILSRRIDITASRRDGTAFPVELTLTAIPLGNAHRFTAFIRDITERKLAENAHRELYERLQASHNGMRTLSRRLLEVQEKERHHLARELHDEIGQTLTAAKINVQQAMCARGGTAAGTHLEESVSLLDHTLQQVRNLALDLRPSMLDDLGLIPTLKWLVERHAQASEVAIRFDCDQLGTRALPEIELACYRVTQESLTNALRHARATQTAVELRKHGQVLELTVSDDGVGFDPDDMLIQAREGGSIGLMGMKERVSLVEGQVEIQSTPGQGTRIRARFPLRASTSP